MPGPFHRIESPTQKVADAIQQQSSNEIWGKPPGNTAQSNLPCVKAYRNSRPSGQRGIDFDTPFIPLPAAAVPLDARWYLGTNGVLQRTDSTGTVYAAIPLSRFFNGQP